MKWFPACAVSEIPEKHAQEIAMLLEGEEQKDDEKVLQGASALSIALRTPAATVSTGLYGYRLRRHGAHLLLAEQEATRESACSPREHGTSLGEKQAWHR